MKLLLAGGSNKRKFKARLRTALSPLSGAEANELVLRCVTIFERIHEIAEKAYAEVLLTEDEQTYLGSLPLDGALKSELWQTAMFAQFR